MDGAAGMDGGDGSLKDTVMSSMLKEFHSLKEKFKNEEDEGEDSVTGATPGVFYSGPRFGALPELFPAGGNDRPSLRVRLVHPRSWCNSGLCVCGARC